MLSYLHCLIIGGAIIGCAAAIGPATDQKPVSESLDYVRLQTQDFALTVHHLRQAIDHLKASDPVSVMQVRTALTSCRIQYKKISFFLDYFYPQQGRLFNAPAKTEIEEPSLEVEPPQSLQQIEFVLFSRETHSKKKKLQDLILVLDESAEGLPSLYAGFDGSNAQIAESLHLELIRIMTLYITGYDAPYLKSGIAESHEALESIKRMSDIVYYSSKSKTAKLDSSLNRAIQFTRSADFDHFDRLTFLKFYALPMEEQLRLRQNTGGSALNDKSGNWFEVEGKKTQSISDADENIGRALFFDKSLSGNNSRSCATCHQPDKYFTDGLVANRKLNSDSLLRRNTPTLLYSACQTSQFWDGRAGSLEEQITTVLSSPDEMNTSISEIKKRLSLNSQYRKYFRDSVDLVHIVAALKSYLHTLQPMNSNFDRFLRGNDMAMSVSQKRGFNLFMGKANCGTCHFAPVFNGSIPPYYDRSEYEVIGVPMNTASRSDKNDTDLGRYERFAIADYLRAFKTPTVRNVTMTGPYMHNGRFKTLQEVVEFYNKGGGAGIGLSGAEQTLSKEPLHLSHREVSDIVAFLESLTDDLKHSGSPEPSFRFFTK